MKHVSSPFTGKRARRAASFGLANAAIMVSGALAASAVANYVLAKRAERANPPEGRFVEVDGVSLHYVERGTGDPLVLLHGNGSMIQDFETSGSSTSPPSHSASSSSTDRATDTASGRERPCGPPTPRPT